MKRKYRAYKDSDIIEKAKSVKSIAGLLKALNLKVAGGNYDNIKRKLQQLNVNTSHWTGKAWNRGARLKDWKDYTRGSKLKPHLIEQRSHKCESCLKTKWKHKPIPLELHHKDGNRNNNNLENLELLCCNCHALTDNWRKH